MWSWLGHKRSQVPTAGSPVSDLSGGNQYVLSSVCKMCPNNWCNDSSLLLACFKPDSLLKQMYKQSSELFLFFNYI